MEQNAAFGTFLWARKLPRRGRRRRRGGYLKIGIDPRVNPPRESLGGGGWGRSRGSSTIRCNLELGGAARGFAGDRARKGIRHFLPAGIVPVVISSSVNPTKGAEAARAAAFANRVVRFIVDLMFVRQVPLQSVWIVEGGGTQVTLRGLFVDLGGVIGGGVGLRGWLRLSDRLG